jgi:hypothetical protein
MTETEWLSCTDPEAMLEFLSKASERKLRLFACACCRRLWHYPLEAMDEPGSSWIASIREAVPLGERYADGRAKPRELKAIQSLDGSGVEILYAFLACCGTVEELLEVSGNAIWAVGEYAFASANDQQAPAPDAVAAAAMEVERAAQAGLLHDVFSNPFRPSTIDPAWFARNDGAVSKLAQGAYNERSLPEGTLDRACLVVLADALEDAGCADPGLLGHLRGPGVHVRGCWAVDLALGGAGPRR